MELLQLRYFYESAKTESFARTAEKYMVPTTSVSASVRRLEAELGCRLFHRDSNRIHLSPQGRSFQQALCTAFSALDAAVEALHGPDPDPKPVNLLVRGMRRRVTDLITGYCARHPEAAFQTSFDLAETDPAPYDIIIDEAGAHWQDLRRFELYSMRLRFKCAPTDPLLGRPIYLRQLAGRKFVTMGPGSNLHRVLLESCARAGFQPEFSAQCNDIECYERLIAGGMGIAVGREMPGSDAAYLDVRDFDQRYTLCVFYRDGALRPAVAAFLEYLREQ